MEGRRARKKLSKGFNIRGRKENWGMMGNRKEKGRKRRGRGKGCLKYFKGKREREGKVEGKEVR